MFIVYQITNNINGRYYRGKTSQANWDKGYMGSGKLIKQAIAKYGKENFTRHVMANCDTEEEAYHWEERFIKTHHQDPMSYNMAPGGTGVGAGEAHPFFGKKRPEMLGENNPAFGKPGYWTGKKRPDMTYTISGKRHANTGQKRPQVSKARTGKGNPMYGKKRSPESIFKAKVTFFMNRLKNKTG